MKVTPAAAMALLVLGATALAGEPPACGDERVERAIQEAYADRLAAGGAALPRFKLDTMQEAAFRPGDDGVATRFCRAGIMVYGDGPAEDAGYVRVEGAGSGDAEFGVITCFLSEGRADGCAGYRPPE